VERQSSRKKEKKGSKFQKGFGESLLGEEGGLKREKKRKKIQEVEGKEERKVRL